MLRGEVTSRRIPIVVLRLRGADQAEIEVNVMLDTGFTDALAIDEELVQELGWTRYDRVDIILADGNLQSVNVYEGEIWCDDEWRSVLVQAITGMPLLGMSLLYDHLVTLEAIDGGEVTIEPLE